MTLVSARLPGSSPARNGLPPRRDYVYQGTGYDQIPIPDADLKPYAVEYRQWLPEFARGNTTPRRNPAPPPRPGGAR